MSDPDFEIVHARLEHVAEVAELFDAYRCWYELPSDPAGARHFLQQRLTAGESEIFFLRRGAEAVAFTQLYPFFSSMAMERAWILNDLYVRDDQRRQGAATLLLETAVEFARSLGAAWVQLETKTDNQLARTLYEGHGWKLNSEFVYYSFDLSEDASAS